MEILKCRLCTASDDLIEIFSQEGEHRNIATKINECLPVVVSIHKMYLNYLFYYNF